MYLLEAFIGSLVWLAWVITLVFVLRKILCSFTGSPKIAKASWLKMQINFERAREGFTRANEIQVLLARATRNHALYALVKEATCLTQSAKESNKRLIHWPFAMLNTSWSNAWKPGAQTKGLSVLVTIRSPVSAQPNSDKRACRSVTNYIFFEVSFVCIILLNR